MLTTNVVVTVTWSPDTRWTTPMRSTATTVQRVTTASWRVSASCVQRATTALRAPAWTGRRVHGGRTAPPQAFTRRPSAAPVMQGNTAMGSTSLPCLVRLVCLASLISLVLIAPHCRVWWDWSGVSNLASVNSTSLPCLVRLVCLASLILLVLMTPHCCVRWDWSAWHL